MAKTIKRPYEKQGMWAVEYTIQQDMNTFGAGKHINWCATQAEAERSFDNWVRKGWVIIEDVPAETSASFDSGLMYDQPQPAPKTQTQRKEQTLPYNSVNEAAKTLSNIAGETISVFDPCNGGYWVAVCKRPGSLTNRQQYDERVRSVTTLIDRINQAGVFVSEDSVHLSREGEYCAEIHFYIPRPKDYRGPFAR